VISTSTLSTLPDEEYRAGLAEVLKYAVIRDLSFFDFLERNAAGILDKKSDVLETIISRCCEIKAEVVSRDECESGLRAILNYGHTFAHAIETLSGYHSITHGFAVALGMRVAARLAVLLNILTPEEEKRQDSLFNVYGLPRTFIVDRERAWEIMALDKKVDKGNRIYILPSAIGKVDRVINIEKRLVLESWDAISGKS
jgi:3-dehydroquinate synthetase